VTVSRPLDLTFKWSGPGVGGAIDLLADVVQRRMRRDRMERLYALHPSENFALESNLP